MYIKRIIENEIEKSFSNNKVVMLLGARQVGKTTMIEPFVQKKDGVIFNCDIEVDKLRLIAISKLSPKDAMQSIGNPKLLVIDEAQNFPEIGRIVKRWYDAHVNTKIILLGSSLNLLDIAAEPLTGRNEKIYLTPLLFEELLHTQLWYDYKITNSQLKYEFSEQIQTLLIQHIVYGGYPEVIGSTDKEKYLLNLTIDYLLRDVLQSGLVKSPQLVKRLLLLLAYQVGNKVNISELARTIGIARQTVENYLELLERSYVIFRIGTFSTNLRSEIQKDTKIYFWDTGIRNAILKEFSVSPLRSDIGLLFENWVISEVQKKNLINGSKFNIYFWNKTDGGEVDLVLKGTQIFKACEIKWSKNNSTKGSKSFSNTYKIPVDVITKDTVIDLLLDIT